MIFSHSCDEGAVGLPATSVMSPIAFLSRLWKHLFRVGEVTFKRRSPLMRRRTNPRQNPHREDVVKIPRL